MALGLAATATLAWTLCSAPPELETEVLFDETGVQDWSTARDEQRLRREFSVSQLTQSEKPAGLRWRFVSKGVTFNDIFLKRPIAWGLDRVRVHVKNEAAALTLACKVRDANGAEWTANTVPLRGHADWQWIEFPRAQWKVASWSRDGDGQLDFPLAYLALIAFNVRPGVEYQVLIDRIEILRPQPPVATLARLSLPAQITAGQPFAFDVSFTLDKPCVQKDALLSFGRSGKGWFSVPIVLPTPLPEIAPGQRVDLQEIELRVPKYARGGELSVSLRLGEARIVRKGQPVSAEIALVTVQARKPGRVKASVRRHKGTPTLFINGQPHNGMAWATYHPTVEVFRDFTEAGVTLFTFSATPTEAGYGLSRTVWVAPDEYDYTQLDQRVGMLLEANPDAYFFPRLYLHAPKWWSEQHPGDIVLTDPGDGKVVPFIHSGGKPAPSWASEAWRRDTVAGLERLIDYIETSPYADRVVGYHLASGTTEEWMMWGGNENQWVDYSPVNVARFRTWLKAKYQTIARLQTAWADEKVTFETARIPSKRQRQEAKLGALRDPAREQAIIDFYLYNSALVADTIGYFAHAVKEFSHHQKVVGVFYGYTLQLCGEQRQQNAGHLALQQVLDSPDVDFLCSPTSYAFRQVGGEGTSHFMSLFGSVKLHDKLWFDENDIRTSLSPGKIGGWGRPADLAGDLLQQDKELGNCLVNGSAQWWFDVGSNRYDAPELMARNRDRARNATQALQLDRSSVDEVAMVVDEKSLTCLRVADPMGSWLLLRQLPQLQRIGAPVGHYLVTDLPKIAKHKVFFFMTSLAPTDADRRAIDALKREGHILVFLWASGLYRDGQVDASAMSDLTGISLRMSTEPAALRVTLNDASAVVGGSRGVSYGVDRPIAPVVCSADPQAIVLGTLSDGRPGLVLKEHDGWTAIHSAAPLLPTSVLRGIARHAGAHLYIETEDVVWATRDLLGVSVKDAGKRAVCLPRKTTVRDLYSGANVARNAERFEAGFGNRATRVFVLE